MRFALDRRVRNAPSIAIIVLRASSDVSSTFVISLNNDWNSATAGGLNNAIPRGRVVNLAATSAFLSDIPMLNSSDSSELIKSLTDLRTRPLPDTAHDEKIPNKSEGFRLLTISLTSGEPSNAPSDTILSTAIRSFWSVLIASMAESTAPLTIAATDAGSAIFPSGLRPKLLMKSFSLPEDVSRSESGNEALASLSRLWMM